jgi:hypothetical protein
MPGTPRTFASNAARQRAYRRRKVEESAAILEEAQETQLWAYLVQAAVALARQSGNPLAQQVHRPEAFETLRALADYFHDQAGTPYPERPWGSWPATASEGLPAPPESRAGGKHLR